MAKARLLRQYLADYNREVQGANKDYKERYNHYKTAVETFNKHAAPLDPTDTGGGSFFGYGRGILNEGKVYSERANDGGWSGMFWSQPARELSWDEAVAIGEQQRAAAGNDPLYSALGDQLPGKRPDASTFQGIDYETWTPISKDDPRYAQQLAEAQAAWDKEKGIHDAGGLMFYENAANYRINSKGKTDTYWLPPGTYASAYRAPTNIPTQEVPKEPTFTVNQLEEMASPSNSAAEINRAQAFGYTGKSALVAERDPTKNSAFANLGGDDPSGLKDKGVLARAIAGEI